MSENTKIEWTDATWNPTTGCNKVSPGCKNCYAQRDWARLSKNSKTVYFGRKFEDVMTHPERLETPLNWKKPRRIFVNSMSDLFHEAIPFEFVDKVFAVMALTPWHTYQVLTKRAERMAEYFERHNRDWDCLREAILFSHLLYGRDGKLLPVLTEAGWLFDTYYDDDGGKDSELEYHGELPLPNVWLGVSVENQEQADRRIPELLKVPAKVRFLSCEPLLGEIDLTQYLSRLDWVIVGGESGANARPSHPAWFRLLRDQCRTAGVRFHFKQHGEFLSYTWADMSAEELSEYHRAGAKMITLDFDGRYLSEGDDDTIASLMVRVGKKAAGRVLDGRTWDESPEVNQ